MVFNLEIKEIPNNLTLESIKPGLLFQKLLLEVEINTTEEFIILESNTTLLFKKEGSNKILEVYCEPNGNYINSSTTYFKFFAYFTPELYQSIEDFRAGGNLEVNLNITNLYLLRFEAMGQFNRIQDSKIQVREGKISTDNFFIIQRPIYEHSLEFLLITREQWSEKVLEPYNSINRFIVEMPFHFPDISNHNVNQAELDDLKERIVKGSNIVKKTIKEYAITKDSDKCIDKVRQATDLLHTIPDRHLKYKIYGKYLIEKTTTGSDNISEDIIKEIFKIVDSLFNISSKGPHAVTRSGVPMEYYPKYEDGDTLLNIITFIYYFLSKKFERFFKIQ